jgi:hypothetical protein
MHNAEGIGIRRMTVMADENAEEMEYAEATLEAPPDTWIWCEHCERAYQRKDARQVRDRLVGILMMCAYPECHGDLFMDARLYASVRQRVHPEWPAVPERDQVYGLYD